MKILLAFFVSMGSIVTLGHAYCFTAPRSPAWPQKGCILSGKRYPIGHIERTETCHTCDCSKDGMHCCSVMILPTHYDGEKCKVIFNTKRCDYDVVQKEDPSKACPFVAHVD